MGIFDFSKKNKLEEKDFNILIEYLEKIPSIKKPIAFGSDNGGFWWVKFRLDINHDLAWNVIQELGCIVNYISINERLPTIFYPVSPAPYMNGGPKDFLSWVIENTDSKFKPETLLKWLDERLPRPVDNLNEWIIE